MRSYVHKKLIEAIERLDELPPDSPGFSEWIKAGAHLAFLRANALSEEVIVFASGPYTFIHSMVVPNQLLSSIDEADLLTWSCNPYSSYASYVSGGGRESIWIEREAHWTGSKILDQGTQLVFGRSFEGWSGPGHNYYELHQEYSHLCGIHWRPEHRAYCRFDQNGDLEHVVSISGRADTSEKVALASFKWEPLEDYLAASDSSLVRMYDFTLLRYESFSGWPEGPEQLLRESGQFFYRQKIAGNAAYTRGIQIVGLRRPKAQVFKDMADEWRGKRGKQYAEFIAYDWRNKRVTSISTDPAVTTNYFEAEGNSLPFELSPAFFRPEVLLKYKADKDKYTVGEREVSCRATWHLRGVDVNEAGQIHAYICDLRSLPYSEQLHWKSFNEKPKASISKRAITHDFEGKFAHFRDPLGEVLRVVRRWNEEGVSWWVLREEGLISRVTVPLTSSRDEWAEAFMDLAKLVIEGFEVKNIRARLHTDGVDFEVSEGSIVLLERLNSHSRSPGDQMRLEGLRATQRIRSVVKGHAGNSNAKQLTQEALSEYGSFAEHFRHVCSQVGRELEALDALLSERGIG